MRKLPLSVLLLAPLLALGIYACDQGGPAEPEINRLDPPQVDLLTDMTYGGNPLVGAWWATSYIEGNDEMPAGDLQYVMILRNDGTFSNSVGNDNAADPVLCKDPPQASCSWDGTYTYTATTITVDDRGHPDPDERNFDTHLYVRCGGKLMFLGDGGRLTFQRTGLGQ
jgi:hypothetical protein